MVEISKLQWKENLKHPEQLMDAWGKTMRVQVEMFSQQIPIFSTMKGKYDLLNFIPSRL